MSGDNGSSGVSGRVDAVALDHHAEEIGVARLLEALQRHRVLHHRIVDGLGEGLDDGAGALFRYAALPARTAPSAGASRPPSSSSGQGNVSGS